MGGEMISDFRSSTSSGVCGIKDGNLPLVVQPFRYVFQSEFSTLFTNIHAISIARIEEGVLAMSAGHLTTIFTKVKYLRVHTDPVEVASKLSGDISFASSR